MGVGEITIMYIKDRSRPEDVCSIDKYPELADVCSLENKDKFWI